MKSSEVAMAPLTSLRSNPASKSTHDLTSVDSGVGLDSDLAELQHVEADGEQYETRQLLNEDSDEAADPEMEDQDVEAGKHSQTSQSNRAISAEMVSVVS